MDRYDDDIFFPPKGRSDLVKKARAICKKCPVKKECKSYREETESDYGIWAEETRTERQREARWPR